MKQINNNHGWSLKEMLIFCSILIGFLLLIVVLVNNLYSGVKQLNNEPIETQGYSYKEIEKNLKEAAKKYFEKNKEIDIISSDDLLIEEYITEEKLIPKAENNPCSGYVNKTNQSLEPFISCEKYETEGY